MDSNAFQPDAELQPARHERSMTRRAALMSGLALAAGPVALAATARDAFGQGSRLPGRVVDVLNFALTLEELEAEFYTRGVGTPGLIPAEVRDVFDQVRKHEVSHVAFLRGVLGNQAQPKPAFDYTGGMGRGTGPFTDVFSNPATFMLLAQAFEDTGVRAYKGQAAYLIMHDRILEAALRIHSVEARHASEIRRIRGRNGWINKDAPGMVPPALREVYDGEGNTFQFILATLLRGNQSPPAFDEPLTRGEVLEIVAPFMASGR